MKPLNLNNKHHRDMVAQIIVRYWSSGDFNDILDDFESYNPADPGSYTDITEWLVESLGITCTSDLEVWLRRYEKYFINDSLLTIHKPTGYKFKTQP